MGEVELRASDGDREEAALRLRDAAAEGRLTLEELTERLDAAYAARTRADLERLTDDLPAASGTPAPPAPAPVRRARRRVLALLSGTALRGRTRIEGTLHVVAVMGGVELDLREAELVGDEPTIHVTAIMGGVKVVVPRGVEVDAHDVIAVMAGREVKAPAAPPGAPRIRIKGVLCMAGLEVTAR